MPNILMKIPLIVTLGTQVRADLGTILTKKYKDTS
jgi:hypothetical protein